MKNFAIKNAEYCRIALGPLEQFSIVPQPNDARVYSALSTTMTEHKIHKPGSEPKNYDGTQEFTVRAFWQFLAYRKKETLLLSIEVKLQIDILTSYLLKNLIDDMAKYIYSIGIEEHQTENVELLANQIRDAYSGFLAQEDKTAPLEFKHRSKKYCFSSTKMEHGCRKLRLKTWRDNLPKITENSIIA